MIVAAEGAGARAGLTAGLGVPSSSLIVATEGVRRSAGTVGFSAAAADVPIGRPVSCIGTGARSTTLAVKSAAVAANSGALPSSSVVIVPVVERGASGVVPVVVMNYVSVVPIGSPMIPPPSIATEETDSKTDAEREVGAAIPDSRIGVPSGPRHNRISINQPRIIRGNIDDFWVRRLNDDRRALRLNGLLRRVLKIAGLFSPLAHYLHGIHHVLFLIVVGVAKG